MNKKGQAIISGFLYFFMAITIVALAMPMVRDSIDLGVDALDNYTNFTNYGFIRMLILYWPVFFITMVLVIFVILMKQ